ncbi:MAG: hypothetical protein ACR2LE_03110 [Nocardioidaceae bacterium]
MTHTLGLLPLIGRGRLLQERVNGESLVELAVRKLDAAVDAVIIVLDPSQRPDVVPSVVVESDRVNRLELPADVIGLRETLRKYERVVVHEPLCPFVPDDFLRRLSGSAAAAYPVAGVLPAVDTVKSVHEYFVRETVHRGAVRLVTTPIVARGEEVAEVDDLAASLQDLALLVTNLAHRNHDLELVTAPADSRRVNDKVELSLIAL